MEKYLDDAYLAHMTQVTVIHGRGTGALRTAVHNRLKKLKYVKSYRLGEFGEGDMGVTIVTFKSTYDIVYLIKEETQHHERKTKNTRCR